MTERKITANSGSVQLSWGPPGENGSKESVTGPRFATASSTTMIAIGKRRRALRNCRMERCPRLLRARFRRRLVEADAHLLAGLEHRDHLLGYGYGLAG